MTEEEPPKKRLKSSTTTTTPITILFQEKTAILSKLKYTLEALVPSSPAAASSSDNENEATFTHDEKKKMMMNDLLQTASCEMLQLKRLQREMLTTADTTRIALEHARQVQKHKLLQLENIRYQKAYLLRQLQEYQQPASAATGTTNTAAAAPDATTSTTTTRSVEDQEEDQILRTNLPHLLKLCSDELGGSSSSSSALDILRQYFAAGTPTTATTTNNIDPNDPSYRSVIVTRLTKDLETRSQLNLTLATLKRQMAHYTNQLATHKKLLRTDLPNKLQDMERASQPLQALFSGTAFKAMLNNSAIAAAAGSSSSSSTKTPAITSRNLIGSNRQERLEHATMLPKPLYTLFYQLAAYLDTKINTSSASATAETSELDEMVTTEPSLPPPLPTLEIVTAPASGVILKIPIPLLRGLEAAGTNNATTSTTTTNSTAVSHKMAQIHFEYDSDMDVITAYYCCSSDIAVVHDHYHLSSSSVCWIGELFPGDTGEWSPKSNDKGDDGGDQEGTTTATIGATTTNKQQRRREEQRRPYHWCNYMAGLHVVPQEKECTTTSGNKGNEHDTMDTTNANRYKSTQVIVQALVQRVRAMTTLQWLLQTLSRKPVTLPLHAKYAASTMDTGGNSSSSQPAIRLSSWTDETNAVLLHQQSSSSSTPDAAYRVFVATLKRKKSEETLTLRVFIDVARYPAVPPAWECLKVQSSPSSSLLLPSSSQGSGIGQTTAATVIMAATMSSSRPRPPGFTLATETAGTGGLESLHHPSHYASNNKSNNSNFADSSCGSSSLLYDESLDRLVHKVNYDMESLVVESDDSTYDWILSHQLAELAKGWEEILVAQQHQN